MLNINNLSKKYGEQVVLNDINLTVDSPQIIGLVGNNGSGKTTLLKCISELTTEYTGEIDLQSKLSFSIETPTFFDNLSVLYNLKIFNSINKDNVKTLDEIYDILKKVKLLDAKDKKFKELSLGMKQKLSLARILLTDSNIILLDEPFNGLDILTKHQLKQIIIKLKIEGKIIIVSSHILEELGEISDSIWYLKNGVIENKLNLKDHNRIYTMKINKAENIEEILKNTLDIKKQSSGEGYIKIKAFINEEDIYKTLNKLINSNIQVIEYYDTTNNISDFILDKESGE